MLLAFAAACGGGTTITEITAPTTDSRCPITIGGLPRIPSAGAQVSASVSAPRECTWTITADASWVQVAPATGQGAASVTLSVPANSSESRSTTLTVNGLRLTLTQDGAPPRPSSPSQEPGKGSNDPPDSSEKPKSPESKPPSTTPKPPPQPGIGQCLDEDAAKGGDKGRQRDDDDGDDDDDNGCRERD